jgi:hypothetical protein
MVFHPAPQYWQARSPYGIDIIIFCWNNKLTVLAVVSKQSLSCAIDNVMLAFDNTSHPWLTPKSN